MRSHLARLHGRLVGPPRGVHSDRVLVLCRWQKDERRGDGEERARTRRVAARQPTAQTGAEWCAARGAVEGKDASRDLRHSCMQARKSNEKAKSAIPLGIKIQQNISEFRFHQDHCPAIPTALVLGDAAAAARASAAAADAARKRLQRAVGVAHEHCVPLKRRRMHGGPRRWRRRRRRRRGMGAVVLGVTALVVARVAAARFGAG